MKWIGLIEDSESRVTWLQDRVGDRADVIWSVRVSTWIQKLRDASLTYGPPELLIFDHDLGLGSFEDVDGHNGFHALEQSAEITTAKAYWIWSQNDPARISMTAWARKRWPALPVVGRAFWPGPAQKDLLEALLR